jgi:ATP-dependent DNA ligase
MLFQPPSLVRQSTPFTHADWVFEIKWDGFRALLHLDSSGVRLISRKEVEQELGAEERAIGALRQHAKEHGCQSV